GSGAFTIRHERTSKCLQVKNSRIVTADCKETHETLWKWVSRNRLFNLGSKQCLGLNLANLQSPLKMVVCNSQLMLMLWWRCADASVVGASRYKLTLKNEIVVTASINSSDCWRRNNSSDDICQQPYREIFTKDGNSYGKPCEFPFLFNKTWYHDCIRDKTHTGGEWCATSDNYTRDGSWGICLKPEDGCHDIWEHDPGAESCYQLNTQSALSWKDAYISCLGQGGNLLSIQNATELSYIQAKDGIAERFWIGLNQLDIFGGWQWSDHTPLNFINWNSDMQNSSPLGGSSCVTMDATFGQWQSFHCDTPLPYICRKPFNNTNSELPASSVSDVWKYMETRCDSGWLPHHGFCYMLVNNQVSWSGADQFCKAKNSDLISIHSLAEVELIVTKLQNETKEEMWLGLMNEDMPALFKWSDGSKVVFTYWDQNEPNIPFNSTPNCVSYLGQLGRWRIKSCEEKLKYVCMKKGEILNETKSDRLCSLKEGWERHGDYCYTIRNSEVSFGAQCNLTVMNRFEQEFINSLIGKYSKVEAKYFWIGLQDISHSGRYTWGNVDGEENEAVTYTNWNSLQPAFSGGCVAMSNGKSLGKWETKDCKTFKAFSICKKNIGPPKQPKVLPKPTDQCPPGWQNGSGLACYKFFHRERVLRTRTWEEAERFCEALGGHLPSFSHHEEMKELHSMLRDIISNDRWVWVGLNKRDPDSLGTWQWSDDNSVTTVMPLDYQEDVYDTRDCAALKTIRISRRQYWRFYPYEGKELDFYLKPFHCDAKLEWVCQITKGSTPKMPEWYIPDAVGIHGPSLVIDGSEYWFVLDKHLSYQEASFYCEKNDSDLASVESYTKLRAVLSQIDMLAGEEQKWWLKFIDYEHHSPLQLHPRFYGRFWRDCLYISRRTWYKGYPTNCHLKLPFICEKYNASLLEKHDPQYRPTKGGCPEDWIQFRNKCFLKLKRRYLTFKAANEMCETFGGTLPSITSQADQDFITSLLPDMPKNVWIGLQILYSTKENKWVDGSKLVYSNFHPLLKGKQRRIPINLFDEEMNNQCTVVLNDPKTMRVGAWNFTSCGDTHFLCVCQKPVDLDHAENLTLPALNETLNYQNVQYRIILKNLSWYDAVMKCRENNMMLVSITDQYQQAFLAAQAAHYNYPLWIGLSSTDDEKHYDWSDGKHISFSHWSEQDEETSEDCVFLDTDGFWKTSECSSEKLGAICYLPQNETEKEKVVEHITCPHKVKNTPWISFKNSCYTFMVTNDRWRELRSQEAHHLCKKMNPDAFVLNIRDEEENNFVVEQLRSLGGLATWVWLGLIYDDADNFLKWYDETYLSYQNWREGRPNVKKNQFFAGINYDGFWDIYNYTANWHPQHFNLHSILACKIEMGPRETKPPLPASIPYGDNTYKILQKKLTWYEALKECKKNGMDLASVHNESQQLFLDDIVKRDGYPLWLGLSIHDGSKSNFEWSDGSMFDYNPWEFKSSASTGNCVLLDLKGFWNRTKCTDVAEGAICYTSSKKRQLQLQQTKGSPRCPQNTGTYQWLQYKEHCYAFDMAFYNFSVYTAEDAKNVCQKLDPSATLLTIKDADENKFVSTQIRENDLITKSVWLGLSQNSKDQSLTWLDGSALNYANWGNGTSEVSGKCSVIVSTNGAWSKVDCNNSQRRVVCKAPLGSNHAGVAIAFALFIIIILIAGLIWYLHKKKRLQWGGFSAVRYQRGMNEEETDNMFAKDGNDARNPEECPSSVWIPFGSYCYAFFQGTLNNVESVEDARDLCKGNASGADIISIKNEKENTFILQTFKTHWQGPDYILLGMIFDTDDNSFKWYDESEMNFTKWTEEIDEVLMNTCAFMNTKSGKWEKKSCEEFPLTGTLCKTASAYEKKYLPGKSALTTTVVVIFTIVMIVSTAAVWYLCKRGISSASGPSCTARHSTAQVPYSDETVLVDAEENEYSA
ncbi:lymphocyte antigen 75, partial [Alligator sinensis]|uniref:CD302 antigen n=1 Tax=Alligator sinensis TaxID=38654 RepID=A0A3Q0G8H4_ALLSI